LWSAWRASKAPGSVITGFFIRGSIVLYLRVVEVEVRLSGRGFGRTGLDAQHGQIELRESLWRQLPSSLRLADVHEGRLARGAAALFCHRHVQEFCPEIHEEPP
jgi:hypothetical protein